MVPGGKDDCQLAKKCNVDLNHAAHNIATYRIRIQQSEIVESLK